MIVGKYCPIPLNLLLQCRGGEQRGVIPRDRCTGTGAHLHARATTAAWCKRRVSGRSYHNRSLLDRVRPLILTGKNVILQGCSITVLVRIVSY